jgi:hypothetical protein
VRNETSETLTILVTTDDETFLGAWFNDETMRIAPGEEKTLRIARFERAPHVSFIGSRSEWGCTLDWETANRHAMVVVDGITAPIGPSFRELDPNDLC